MFGLGILSELKNVLFVFVTNNDTKKIRVHTFSLVFIVIKATKLFDGLRIYMIAHHFSNYPFVESTKTAEVLC